MDPKLSGTLSDMIITASGWRGVFARDSSGNTAEESASADISAEHRIIAAAAARVFSDYLRTAAPQKNTVIVGMDTRPTGKAIADAIIRILLAEGREVIYTGVCAAPEIMAFARKSGPDLIGGVLPACACTAECGCSAPDSGFSAPASEDTAKLGFPAPAYGGAQSQHDHGIESAAVSAARMQPGGSAKLCAAGFIYISASHNPIGHNGIKFGLTDGGVLQAGESAKLISAFRLLMEDGAGVEQLRARLGGHYDALCAVYAAEQTWKKAALAAYREFTAEVISGFGDKSRQDEFFALIKKELARRPLGIAADFNGSARTISIDRDFLLSLGSGFYALNEKPGQIAHRIVPEGESLNTLRNFIEELHCKDLSVVLGYMPDCDGDRGNLVVWDNGLKQARSLEAQEVFALACMAELSSLVWSGEISPPGSAEAAGSIKDQEAAGTAEGRKTGRGAETAAPAKPAIAVNDPTSLRIDRIAAAFGAEVFRAEVGEANVVGLARKLREDGYLVRILGEGSAGGTITHPSAVRDPIDTLGAILKLLAVRSGREEGGKGLFQIWCDLSEQAELYRPDFTLEDIIASLPAFTSTGAYTADALLKVKSSDHGLLKDRYQEIFLREWEEKKDVLKEKFGFSGWEALAYNGINEKRGIKNFGEAGKGGLKIEFYRGEESRQAGSRGDKQHGAESGRETSRPDNSRNAGNPGDESGRGRAAAFIWMRGSGTEPVFRVMADAEESSPNIERFLIEWQRRMVLEADGRGV